MGITDMKRLMESDTAYIWNRGVNLSAITKKERCKNSSYNKEAPDKKQYDNRETKKIIKRKLFCIHLLRILKDTVQIYMLILNVYMSVI